MDYNEFLLQAQLDLAKEIPGAVVSRGEVSKLQGESYEGLCVTPEGSQQGVVLNMNDAYAKMEEGSDYKEILSEMVETVGENAGSASQISAEFLSDYGQIRDRLTVELVGQEQNRERLTDIPHFDMEDLSLVYRIDVSDMVGNGLEGRASVLVTNNLLEQYGVTQEQLHQDALENTASREPYSIIGMGTVLSGMLGIPVQDTSEQQSLYVVTNASMMYGAAAIAYPGFMDKATEQVGGDFYILPSSIHEVLLIKDDGMFDHRELEKMVCEVNGKPDVVHPDELLSNRVYHYDSKEKVFELAEKFEARQQERSEERHSVLKDLKTFGHVAEQYKPDKSKPVPACEMAL